MKQKASITTERTEECQCLFPPGNVFCTPGVIREIAAHETVRSLGRHLAGDWGDIDYHDWEQNELALENGGHLLSVYHTAAERKYWIITEADRSATTILLPEEY